LSHVRSPSTAALTGLAVVIVVAALKLLAAAADGKHHIETVWGRGYMWGGPGADA